MKFFIDSTDINEIKELDAFGIVDGVTTNPSLMAKQGKDFRRIAEELCQAIAGPVSLEVGATKYDNMIEEGRVIFSIAKNAVLKLPMTWDGIKACKFFTKRDYPVNMTLCFSVNQALLAAKAGARYISPFVGRIDDIGHNGLDLIADIRAMYDNYGFETEILAASIRNIYHLQQAAMIGADIATCPTKVIKQMIDSPLTDIGLKKFSDDWQKSGLKI